MRFWRELKYFLLVELVSDVCTKSGDCSNCEGHYECEIEGLNCCKFSACSAHDIYRQARKVWKLED